MSVVVVGDANVDLEIRLPRSKTSVHHANPAPRLRGGGSAANTAAALARLGIDCRFVGSVGNDAYGRFAIASLTEAGVDTGSVETTSEAVTVTVITVVPPDGERLIYVWPSSGGAHGVLQAAEAVMGTAGADWLHVSGICLRLSPSRDAVFAAMDRANRDGVPVSLDLNLRLENWGWDDGFREVVEGAVARAHVVLGSAADEIVPLAGIDDPMESAMKVAGDSRLVIARRGAAGAIACSTAGVVTVPGFGIEVADTVGAGAAFNAGFIAARLRGANLTEALRSANAVAALTVSQPGARSTPLPEEVESLLVS